MTDRELDAKIAEYLFGWTEIDTAREFSGWDFTDTPGSWEYEGSTGVGREPGMHMTSRAPYPPYSSTGDGMLAVLEALKKRGCTNAGVFWIPRFEGGKWCAVTEEGGDYTMADSAPRAVCLATLAALGAGLKETKDVP